MTQDKNTDIREHVMNVAGQKLGRVATEIATVLMGKDTPLFAKNVVPRVKVVVEGASELDLGEKKLSEKQYQRYSGYPGGRKTFTMAEVVAKKGAAEVLRKAVYGMLPSNKLRASRMKRLIIK